MYLAAGILDASIGSDTTGAPCPAIDTDAVTAALPLHLPPGRAGDDPAATGRSSAGPRTGELIDDRYRIAEQIGHGGSAAVYRGLDTRLQRPVAVKIFHPSATDPRVISRRRAEVDFLVRLNHGGLVALFDANLTPTAGSQAPSYLVMELVDGTSLEHRLGSGVLTTAGTADIGRQLATALAVPPVQTPTFARRSFLRLLSGGPRRLLSDITGGDHIAAELGFI